MPLAVDLDRRPTQFAAGIMRTAHPILINNGYDRPIQRCPPYHPGFWSAAAPTPPSLPTLAPPSTFAFGAPNLPALPSSFDVGIPGNPPPSPATNYVRLQYQLLLAGMLHG